MKRERGNVFLSRRRKSNQIPRIETGDRVSKARAEEDSTAEDSNTEAVVVAGEITGSFAAKKSS